MSSKTVTSLDDKLIELDFTNMINGRQKFHYLPSSNFHFVINNTVYVIIIYWCSNNLENVK